MGEGCEYVIEEGYFGEQGNMEILYWLARGVPHYYVTNTINTLIKTIIDHF